jgi:hypothetical protein
MDPKEVEPKEVDPKPFVQEPMVRLLAVWEPMSGAPPVQGMPRAPHQELLPAGG